MGRAFSTEAEFTKEEVLDILFYMKEVFGFIIGIIVGVIGLMGLTGLIAYVLAASILSYLYVYKFLGVEEDTVETKDTLKEHFMNGFFPFLLTWIILHNLINY
jgi:hypothetical protein